MWLVLLITQKKVREFGVVFSRQANTLDINATNIQRKISKLKF